MHTQFIAKRMMIIYPSLPEAVPRRENFQAETGNSQENWDKLVIIDKGRWAL